MSDFTEPQEASGDALRALGTTSEADATEQETGSPEELEAWVERLSLAFQATCAYLAQFDASWATSQAEINSLATAWAPVAVEASGGAEVPPLYVAIGLTGMWALPRTVTTIKNRREARASELVFGGTGQREDHPDETGFEPADWPDDPLGSEQ